jgi:hypothetical protein
MAKKAKPSTPKTAALPKGGGTFVRQPDGSLVRDAGPVQKGIKAPVKES